MADQAISDNTILKILSGTQAGAEVSLVKGEYLIGSGSDDDIQIIDVSLKPGHAKIRVAAGKIVLKKQHIDLREVAQQTISVAQPMADVQGVEVRTAFPDRPLIVEADPVVKGQTASSSYKPAILDNGVRVMVPPHITAGTRIVVDVYNQEYVRRAE